METRPEDEHAVSFPLILVIHTLMIRKGGEREIYIPISQTPPGFFSL